MVAQPQAQRLNRCAVLEVFFRKRANGIAPTHRGQACLPELMEKNAAPN